MRHAHHGPWRLLILTGLTLAATGTGVESASTWTNAASWRALPITAPAPGRTGFTALTPASTGILFTNSVPLSRHVTNQILLNGSGVAAGDLDGDGWCDVVLGGLGGRTSFYRNAGGWRFENVTARVGVDLTKLDATGVVAADTDGDGDLDVVLNTVGQGTWLLENQGGGQFKAQRSLLNPGRCGTSSALGDVDGDGDLDLYIANYRVTTMRDEPDAGFTIRGDRGQPRVTAYGNRPITAPDLADRFKFHYQPTPDGGATVFHDEQGEPDIFYRNEGRGYFVAMSSSNQVFVDATGTSLKELPFDWGLSAMIRDFNGDQAPDIYVCNDFSSPDRLWINNGSGRFRPVASTALRQTSLSSMAVDVADIDRDGFDDIFTADMLSTERWRRLVQINQANPNLHLFVDLAERAQSPRNTLQLNCGDGSYAEVAQMVGLEASGWSWASVFLDVDLDGFEDLLVANGFERDFMNMDANRRVRAAQAAVPRGQPPAMKLAANRIYPRLATPNLAFRNLGNLKFVEVGNAWGFDVPAVSQGMGLGDFDNDGDLDVVINNMNGPATVLRNETTASRLAVRLKGNAPNTRGIGARITVTGGAVPSQSQEMLGGGRYLSGDDALRVFAAGAGTNNLTVEVKWRSGLRTVATNLAANQIYEMAEPRSGGESAAKAITSARSAPLFQDVSHLLNHSHEHAVHDDFGMQPLLPYRLDAAGVGVCWLDMDGDGRDELILPAGRNHEMAVYRNTAGGFLREPPQRLRQSPGQPQTGVVGWRAVSGATVLVAGLGYSTGSSEAPKLREYRSEGEGEGGGAAMPAWPAPSVSGPLALADIDADGDLDLFVGGRSVPGRWPEPASSAIFRQHQGRWIFDTINSNLLHAVGLVSAATFADIDGDRDPDLVLACEWGPLRIFLNDAGRFSVWERRVTFERATPAPKGVGSLTELTGWWTGVAAGDFDGDGRFDLVAGNWGRNTKYERFRSEPLRVYFGDFLGDGSVGIMEAWFDPAAKRYAPIHDVWLLSRSLPWLLTRFNSYESFARAGIEEALGQYFGGARFLQAAWLDSTVFLNRIDRFEVRSLPAMAQIAPIMGPCVADFDADGVEDLFLSQNHFAMRPETSRADAGRGLLLKGDGTGNFSPVDGVASGLAIYGEQRGAATCDYDHDGRVDLAVSQYQGTTRLYRNTGASEGVRVRLRGPQGNPQAIGAVLRWKTHPAASPAREVRAGSGYWSQDSAVQVMTRPPGASKLMIQWPGGRDTELDVAKDQREVEISY